MRTLAELSARNRSATFTLILSLAVLVLSCGRPAAPPPEAAKEAGGQPAPVVKYGVTVVPGPMDAILLKDYRPESSLRVPETRPPRAGFPAIDVHAHSYADSPEEVRAWVRTMDEAGVEKTIVLTDETGPEFDRLVELYLGPYPDRFQLFCGIDTSGQGEKDYSSRVVQELVRCHQKGARGVGEVSDKGWGIGRNSKSPLPRAQRLHPDDPRLDAFWDKCAELELPVNVHIADHPSCWRPLGPAQERTPDFQVFNLHGKDVPSYEELLAARDRLLVRHSKTRFIFCHLSNQGHDLASAGAALERFPNLHMDISARDYELGRQPRAALRFIERFKDRLLFGTDMGRDKTVYEGWWRLLETADEFIPGRIWWRYYGLALPPPLLESLYRGNARRLLNWTPIRAARLLPHPTQAGGSKGKQARTAGG